MHIYSALAIDLFACYIRLNYKLNVDEFYRHLTRWVFTGNPPFTEVENLELLELVGYIKPAFQENIVKSQAIQNCVFSHAGILWHSMKLYIS